MDFKRKTFDDRFFSDRRGAERQPVYDCMRKRFAVVVAQSTFVDPSFLFKPAIFRQILFSMRSIQAWHGTHLKKHSESLAQMW